MTIIKPTVESLPKLHCVKRINELTESGELFGDGADYLRSILDKLEDDEIINLMAILRLDENNKAIAFSVMGDYYDHRIEQRELLVVNDGIVTH